MTAARARALTLACLLGVPLVGCVPMMRGAESLVSLGGDPSKSAALAALQGFANDWSRGQLDEAANVFVEHDGELVVDRGAPVRGHGNLVEALARIGQGGRVRTDFSVSQNVARTGGVDQMGTITVTEYASGAQARTRSGRFVARFQANDDGEWFFQRLELDFNQP